MSIKSAGLLQDAIEISKNGTDDSGSLHDFRVWAFENRAQYLADFFGDITPEVSKKRIYDAIRSLTLDENGELVSASEFEKRFSGLLNLVMTGHPTFSKTPEGNRVLSEYFTTIAKGQPVTDELRAKVEDVVKEPFVAPDLNSESEQSIEALENIHKALKVIERVGIETAKECFPSEWKKLNYSPGKAFTWIPYDWDGRADITWNKVLGATCHYQSLMLADYAGDIEGIESSLPKGSLEALRERIDFTIQKASEFHHFLDSYQQKADPNLSELAEWSREEFVGTRNDRIRHSQEIIDVLQPLLEDDLDEQTQIKLVHMISRLQNHGLALAQPHFRINSKQLITALAEQKAAHGIEIDTALDGEILDTSILKDLTDQLPQSSNSSNILDVAQSRQSAVTQMMLARQIADDLDSHMRPRWLIAEAHAATHVLAALYFAQKMGVDKHVVVSPLFEDEDGIKGAKRIMSRLFENLPYRDYISEIKEVAIELGYSDSGRFIGSHSAGSELERVKGQIITLHSKAGLNVPLSFYDTHGESPGRGAHPISLENRFETIFSSWFMDFARRKGVRITNEESIQGGDGYIPLLRPESALAYYAEAFSHLTEGRISNSPLNDPYYEEYRSDASAFYKSAREAHSLLSENNDYAAFIDFARIMPQTGSRPVQRAQQSGGARKLPRAIPHNGILMQLGAWTNMVYGLGVAIEENPKRFRDLMTSDTFRLRMDRVNFAVQHIDLNILESYMELYNPDFWLGQESSGQERNTNIRIASELQTMGAYGTYHSVSTRIKLDCERLKGHWGQYYDVGSPLPEKVYAAHAHRLAAMMNVMKHAVEIPTPSNPSDLSHSEIIAGLFRMDSHTLGQLRNAFETANGYHSRPNCGKPSGFTNGTDYRHLDAEHLKPIAHAINTIHEYSLGLVDYNRSVG